jgi:hypothetical protein
MRRFFQFFYIFALGLLAGGCASGPVASESEPAPTIEVTRKEAWRDAELITGLGRDRFTLIGSGTSMLPVYGEDTVLVVVKIDFAELRPGMQVAYMTQRGSRVVHVLVGQEAGGWRVKGLNNEAEDRERVTPYNLVGVVYASFTTDGGGKK